MVATRLILVLVSDPEDFLAPTAEDMYPTLSQAVSQQNTVHHSYKILLYLCIYILGIHIKYYYNCAVDKGSSG
jgi:hypothetical protein